MKNKTAKKTFNNVISGVFYQLTNMLVNFLITPLIILKFGSSINGMVQSIRQILGYIQFVGAGISESTVVSLYEPISKNDKNKISAIINACGQVFFKAGSIFSLISLVLAAIYPFIFNIELSKTEVFFLVCVLCISGASEFFVVGKYRALLTADQNISVVNFVQSLGLILSLIVTYTLVKLNFGIVIVQLGLSLAYVSRLLFLVVYVRKNYKFLDKNISSDMSALSKRRAATIHQLSGIITFGSQIVIATYFCGNKEASVYSVYALIFTGINTLLGVFSSALLALFGDLLVSNNKEKMKKFFRTYELGFYLLVFTIYSVTYLLSLDFIKLYTKGVSDVNYVRSELVVLFSLMGLLNCLRTPGATIINAAGHYGETKNRALIEMTICFVLQLVLVTKYGLVGILVATILAYLYRTLDVLWYSNKKILKDKIFFTTKILVVNISLIIILCIIKEKIVLNINSYLSWVKYGLIFTFVIGCLFLVVNIIFNYKTFKEIYNVVVSKFKKA